MRPRNQRQVQPCSVVSQGLTSLDGRSTATAAKQQEFRRKVWKWLLLIALISLEFAVSPSTSPRLSESFDNNGTDPNSLDTTSFSLVRVSSETASVDLPSTPAATSIPSPTMSNHSSSSCDGFQVPKGVEKDCLMSYLATYPGSGSELCLELIEGLTGFKTGHAYPFLNNNSQSQKVVVLKTHYPNKIIRGGHPDHNPVRVSRAIYLLRNPMHALPSFFNFISEQKSQQRRHTQQAPLEEWIDWRDDMFSSKLYLWRFHMDFWLSQHHLLPDASFVLSENDTLHKKRVNKTMIMVRYEHLIDPTKGPLLLEQMSMFLQRNENVTSAVPPQTCHVCGSILWYNVVPRNVIPEASVMFHPTARSNCWT